ncbi:MAG: alpha/beta hydrolase [Xanthomonadaceae bacterium]|nr:alpha/beta hydrolase [Xanthomonadaceae bacterium]
MAMPRLFAAVLVLMLTACSTTPAAPPAPPANVDIVPLNYLPSLKGDYLRLASKETGWPYHVYVRFPEGYDPTGGKRYPVVYLLDGDSLFPMLAPTHLFLTYDEKLPEAVVVGIAYGGFDRATNKRDIDFNPPAGDGKPGEDGAPRFLRFLEHELLPTVESRYRIDPSRRVLVGQSRSGYFVLWSAMQAPDLFWGRIASNPATTPGRDAFFAGAAPHQRDGLRVAVAIGEREPKFRQDFVDEWTQAWQSRDATPWQVKRLPIANGTHAASIGESYRQAMLWLFDAEVQAARQAAAASDH